VCALTERIAIEEQRRRRVGPGPGQRQVRGLRPLAAKASELVGLSPAIAGSAVLAACIMSAPAQWRRERPAAIRDSPVGYLFRIEGAASPGTLIDRPRMVWPKR
jgi:hypothetical protein